jgi:SAM-dependent methyltransferase
MKKTIYKIYKKIFPDYQMNLDKLTKDCKSLLDIGCGDNSPIHTFSNRMYCVGIDIFEPSLEKSKKKKIHNEYYKIDYAQAEKIFEKNSFDCVLASDFIEHLEKEEGYKLLRIMEKLAKKKVIIFTPKGFLPTGEYEGNPWQVHKSGWDVEEMEKRGYKVYGINGLKSLREGLAKIRFKPRFFWLIISNISQYYTKYHPKKAFHLLCIKDISK